MSQPQAGASTARGVKGDLLATLVHHSPLTQVVFDVDRNGELIGVIATRAAYRSRLLTVPDVAGLTSRAALRPGTADALQEGYFECARSGAPYSYEEFIDIDGRETWWMTTLSPELTDDGRVCRLIATFLHVDFVRDTEQALRSSEANFRGLIEGSPDALIVCRVDGTIVYSNQAAASMLGADRASDVCARTLETLIATKDRASFTDRMTTALLEGGPEPPQEIELWKLTGGSVHVEVAMISLVFDGEPRLLLVGRDVTERKQMQRQLALADRLIALGTMAAGVAHEINNPLTYILGNITFAIEELEALAPAEPGAGDTSGEVLRALREAVDGTDRVRRIVLDMKYLTQSSDEERAAVSVDRALDAALKIAHREISHRARLVRTRREPPPVIANETRLVQVFLNLLLNAAHAIASGAVDNNEIRVETAVGDDGLVVVEIHDSGSGISAEHLARLFDPFFTTKPVGTGMGLGLSISQRAIADLGGKISVQSEVGKGSLFRVEIPQMRESLAPKPTSSLPAQVRRRVLVVDDDALVGRAVARMMQREHTVTYLSRAQEALALLASGCTFDVVLCDLMMPEMTGMEFFEALAVRVPDMAPRVAFMSGGAFTPAATRFLATVANPVLDKPFNASQFRAVLVDLCRDIQKEDA